MRTQWNKHPAKNEYRSQTTANDNTTRTAYNIATNEGKKIINLDYLTTGIGDDITGAEEDPSEGFINYYGNLLSQPRTIIRSNIVNPEFFDMELGDICDFSNMIPSKAFNKSFSGRKFMITELTRSSGRLDVVWIDVTPRT